jgi:UV DNA damage endonuclease
MTPNLGLVCITTSDAVRFRTITRTRVRTFPLAEQTTILRALYLDNLDRLAAALSFCERNDLRLYRLPSGLFPQSEEPPGYDVLEEFAPRMKMLGRRATKSGIRLVMHPDQYVVLNSEREEVVRNSVTILSHHARVLDLLGQPLSPWTAIEIHGGKGGRAQPLVETIRALPANIRSRLVLENDEDCYSAPEILGICREAEVPMVFDAHHHICHEGLDSYDDPSVAHFLAAARDTWPDPAWQMVHISNGKESFGDTRHADFIEVMPSSFRDAPWIEVEAKAKELAIEKLKREWLDVPVSG